ncbi:MAG: SHOCT domain-containing protein [Desulfobacterales bacterium]|nr:SHOCT domain-containing protein [Desulfobacterales bacterium]
MFKNRHNDSNVIKGVFIACFILLFHVVLLAVVGLLVIFFSGIINYLPWILLGGLALIAGCGYILLRYLRKNSGSLVKVLSLPEFQGKNIEVSVLGGLASVKINGEESNHRMIGTGSRNHAVGSPEDDQSTEISDLTRLAGLLEDDLITREEYQQAKQRLFDR